jgi:hypothetical protein
MPSSPRASSDPATPTPTNTAAATPVNCYDLDGRWGFKKFFKKAGRLAWKYKYDIALTALSFTPGIGAGFWAYRAYRLTRLAEVGLKAGAKAPRRSRATSWLAGRMWVGRGGKRTVADNGAPICSRGEGAAQRAWRGAPWKHGYGYSSNLTRSIRGRHAYSNFQIRHRRWF